MHDKLTASDIKKMEDEIEYRKLELRKELIQDVKDAINKVLTEDKRVLKEPAPFVRLSEYKDSSIEYTVRGWANLGDYWDTYFDVLENIKYEFDNRNIEMTYNHLNVHLMNK